MTNDSTATSRRAMCAETANRSDWQEAMEAWTAAKAAAEADDQRFNETHRAWEASKPSIDAIDWRNLPGFIHSGQCTDFAERKDLEALERDFIAGEGKWWWAGPDVKAKRLAAIDSIRTYRARAEVNSAAHALNEAVERNDRLGEAACLMHDALMTMPSPDLPALLWKLEQVFQEDEPGFLPTWSKAFLQPTLDDARRLLSGEA